MSSRTELAAECRRCRRDVARAWDRGETTLPRGEHAQSCRDCADYLARLDAARAALREHHAGVQPGAAFAPKVMAAVRARRAAPAEVMGALALRFLPAALALVLALGLWASQGLGSTEEAVVTAPSDDLLAWVLETTGDAP